MRGIDRENADLVTTTLPDRGLDNSEPVQYCPYCHAQLNPLFYFCTSCSTPYKDPSVIVGKAQGFTITSSQRLKQNAPFLVDYFWTFFGTIFGLSLVLHFLFGDKNPEIAVYVQSSAFVVMALISALLFRDTISDSFKRFGFFNRYFLIGLAGTACLLFINYWYHFFISKIGSFESEPLTEPGINKYFNIVIFCLVPAVTEEVIFRGVMQSWLLKVYSEKKSLLICAGLFSMVHFSAVSFPYLFLVGLLLSYIKIRTKSIYPVMILHFLHNFAVITFFTIIPEFWS